MKWKELYITACALFFMTVAVILAFGERSSYSESERRELAVFPDFSFESLADGSFTAGINAWYADTVPCRELLTKAALKLNELKGIRLKADEEEISFHNVGGVIEEDEEDADTPSVSRNSVKRESVSRDSISSERVSRDSVSRNSVSSNALAEQYPSSPSMPAPEHENSIIQDNNAVSIAEAFTMASNGIIISGSGENTRAIMLYGGSSPVTTAYAECANHYKELMPDLNVYVCIIPTAVSYYCPDAAKPYTGSQLKQINNVMEHLSPDVIGIDIYTILGEHSEEPIYLRTDHHWAPLGAYYAASKIAEAAGVPFLSLEDYDMHVVHGYVGSMFMYSEDIRVSENPEDFVYYVPRNVNFTTTYTNYLLDADWNVIAEDMPKQGQFFLHYPDGSNGAYCTFMGGDAKITRVETDTENGRKLLILKDSFGNAIPGYLFGSFEEVHVIDSRYFTRNIQEYIREYGITDLLFANNAFHASTGSTVNSYERYLIQGTGEETEAESVSE